MTAKPRKPLLVRIGAASVAYAAGVWLAIDYGHYVELVIRRGRDIDLDSLQWMPHSAEACFVVGTAILVVPVIRRLAHRVFGDVQ